MALCQIHAGLAALAGKLFVMWLEMIMLGEYL